MLVVADGPKSDRTDDAEKCGKVIDLIKSIDWPADVEWNVAPTNMGLRARIQNGLTWAFGRVEEAIVLEDDCVPHPSFFPFCAELLDRYRNNPQIALICGSSFQFDADCGPASYFFSRYPLMWGWATWRRTWERYDPDIDEWANLRRTSWLADYLGDPLAAAYWRNIFDKVSAGLDTWDFQMNFLCWRQDLLAVQPAHSMIANVGFGPDATFTRETDTVFSRIPVREMQFPLIHPERVERAKNCDDRTEKITFSASPRQQLERVRAARAAGATSTIWKPGTLSQ